MKLLFTEGIGASQTTTNAQDEKIPVYETKTAAENDLANLEVGQIVATKDEGNELSNPVDVVQDGNMHAVTSNAVAESLCTISTPPFDSNYILWAREIYNPITKVVTILARVRHDTSPILGQNLVTPIHKGNNDFYPDVDVKISKYYDKNFRILLRGELYNLQIDGITDTAIQLEISYIAI